MHETEIFPEIIIKRKQSLFFYKPVVHFDMFIDVLVFLLFSHCTSFIKRLPNVKIFKRKKRKRKKI